MLKKINKKKMLMNKNSLKIILSIFIVLFMLIFIIIGKSKNNRNKIELEVSKEEILTLFDKINDNYSLVVEKTINGITNKFEYSTDSVITLYESNLLNDKGYLIYNNKLYSIDFDSKKLEKTSDNPDFINDKYYDIKLIKRLVNYCDFEYINVVKTICKINTSDYINEYNQMYNLNIETIVNNKMEIQIVHYTDRIGKVIIDYTNLNKILNNSDDEIVYGIKISDTDSNDFNLLLESYRDVLE